ncbi:type IX secretion system membrane protein PorP/SprF [Flavobacteriaceae bacterium AU392]|nr:type IX secretion system membrane protein PorP/SprF [Flavobacteriaceae bacterium]RKM85735.1 type IX secretion system membrane protein PorP/SprF [Flavobacteriaceae bacterium AU392]
MIRYKKNTFFLITFCLCIGFSFAQQLPQFTQYIYNTVSINPAYAGTREKFNITVLNRNQWVGVDGAPVTQTFSSDTNLEESNVGIGLSVINDRLGFEKITYAYADVSYTINLNDDYRLTFGLKAGGTRYGIDSELLTDPDAIGDIFLDRTFNRWEPNFGAGIYYRSDDWFIAFSSPRIINYAGNTNTDFLGIERVSYYLNGGYLLNLHSRVTFRPTFLVKYTNGAPASVDLTANFLINKKLWLGTSYRVGESFGGLATFQVTNNLKAGYSYEYNTSKIRQFTTGSHEIFLIYEFELFRPKCNCGNKF